MMKHSTRILLVLMLVFALTGSGAEAGISPAQRVELDRMNELIAGGTLTSEELQEISSQIEFLSDRFMDADLAMELGIIIKNKNISKKIREYSNSDDPFENDIASRALSVMACATSEISQISIANPENLELNQVAADAVNNIAVLQERIQKLSAINDSIFSEVNESINCLSSAVNLLSSSQHDAVVRQTVTIIEILADAIMQMIDEGIVSQETNTALSNLKNAVSNLQNNSSVMNHPDLQNQVGRLKDSLENIQIYDTGEPQDKEPEFKQMDSKTLESLQEEADSEARADDEEATNDLGPASPAQ